jgi:putative transposase
MFKTIKLETSPNIGKIERAYELVKPFQNTLSEMIVYMDKRLKMHGELPKAHKCPFKAEDVSEPISARQVQTLWSQATETFNSWLGCLERQSRDYIVDSSLDDDTKVKLLHINKKNGWFKKDTSYEHRLIRSIIKQAEKRRGRPNLLKCRTFKLDAKVADLQRSSNSYDFWLKLSAMQKGKPIYLPVTASSYFYEEAVKGALKKFVQIEFKDGIIRVNPIIEIEDAPNREEGKEIGLDWGVSCLFATSDGRRFGNSFLENLASVDKVLTEHAAELQRQGIKLKTDPTYIRLSSTIRSYIKNEVGRILNKLAKEDIANMVVEKLYFRHRNLSKRMNRILSKAGRAEVEKKLERLREEYGITIIKVNAAYTSQECSSCGHTLKSNRKSQSRFVCICCGFRSNADVNAAKNILSRRSRQFIANESSAKQRKTLLDVLQEEHLKRCPSGKHLAKQEVVGSCCIA